MKRILFLILFHLLTKNSFSQNTLEDYNYISDEKGIWGVSIGQFISSIPKNKIEPFPYIIHEEKRKMFYLLSTSQKRIAILYSDVVHKKMISCIEILSRNAITEHGFKIGTTFLEISTQFTPKQLKIFNDKTNHSTIIVIGNLAYTMDFFSNSEVFSFQEIPLTSKVLTIQIR